MAVPHVTGAAAFVNASLGLSGAALRTALFSAVESIRLWQGGRSRVGG